MGINVDRTDKETLDIINAIDNSDDLRKSLAALKARIRHFESAGQMVPKALKNAERQVVVELAAESQGR